MSFLLGNQNVRFLMTRSILLFAWERGRFPSVTANVIRLKLATLLENIFEASGKLNKDTDQLLYPRG